MELMPSLEKFEDEDEIELAPNAMPLDLLQAIYRNPALPNSTRMRAAQIAIAYEFPKLAVTANVLDDGTFAAKLDRAIQRTRQVQEGKVKMIEAKPVEHSPTEAKSPNAGRFNRRV